MGTKIIRFDDLTGQEGNEVTEVEGTIAESTFKLDLAPGTLDALRRALIDHDPTGLARLLSRQIPAATAKSKSKTDDTEWVMVDGIRYQRERPRFQKIKDEC